MGNKIIRHICSLSPLTFTAWDGTTYSVGAPLIGGMTRTASDNPKYKSLTSVNKPASNSMVVTVDVCTLSPGIATFYGTYRWDARIQYKTYSIKRFADSYAKFVAPLSESIKTSVNNKALIGLIKKIRTHQQSDFSGPTFIGEFRSLVKGIRRPFETIRNHLNILVNLERRIKHDKLKRRGKSDTNMAQAISSSWLEFTFGVMPAVNDITEICKILSSKFDRRPGTARLSYRFTDGQASESSELFACPACMPSERAKLVTKNKRTYSVQYLVGVKRDFPQMTKAQTPIQQLIDYGRFDLAEIVPTAWELIPFSWLVDYVSNVGDVLNCGFDYNSSVVWGQKTSIDSSFVTRTATDYYPNTNYNNLVAFIPERFTSEQKTITRSAVTSLDYPSLEFQLPSIGQANNVLQLVIALASSSLNKR